MDTSHTSIDTAPQQPRGGPQRRQRVGMARTARSAGLATRAVRRGGVLFVAVVCIAVASVIFLALLQLSVAERRRAETAAWQVQAAWLAESGLERAAARLAGNPDYEGETWSLPADVLGTGQGAVVRIQVEKVPEQAERRLVRVEADYPEHPQHRARHSKQLVMEVRPSS